MSYLDRIKFSTKIVSTNRSAQDLINDWFETANELDNINNIPNHEDIPVFGFKPLNEIRQQLIQAGHTTEHVNSIINGLSELPEYASKSNTDETSGR